MNPIVHNLFNTFLHNQNQFASGGLLLMAVGSVIAYLRNIPLQIWNFIVHQTTVTLSLTDDQKAYYWVKDWIEQQRIMRRTRHMDVFNQGVEKYVMIPAPGHHWMLYKGRILSVTIVRKEEKTVGEGWAGSARRPESIVFKTLGRKQTIFRDLMAEVHNTFVQKVEKKPMLFAWGSWGEWLQVHSYQPRPLDSVITPAGEKESLVRDIEVFKSSRDWYKAMGIPYRKGYLFYGPPGTGKTSLVTGLSSHFNANVYILKLSDMTDTTLVEAVKAVETNSFLIVEDIDGVSASARRTKKTAGKKKEGEEKEKEKGVTLSGLLNVVDGLLSPAGGVFIFTTNHREKLDPALIRPGRVDKEMHMTYATDDQKKGLYNRFQTGDCPQEYLDNKKMTMAELQQILMAGRVNGSAS